MWFLQEFTRCVLYETSLDREVLFYILFARYARLSLGTELVNKNIRHTFALYKKSKIKIIYVSKPFDHFGLPYKKWKFACMLGKVVSLFRFVFLMLRLHGYGKKEQKRPFLDKNKCLIYEIGFHRGSYILFAILINEEFSSTFKYTLNALYLNSIKKMWISRKCQLLIIKKNLSVE